MARKKRKKEETYEFKVPQFDEAGFMRKEIEGAKAALVTIAYAFIVGLASYSLSLLGVGYLAVLVGFAALYGLKYVYPALNLDVAKFDRKTWVGNGAVFLFAWLAFWVLLLNPPFLDISPPVVQKVEFMPQGNPPELNPGGQNQTMLALGGNSSFEVRARVVDNIRVAKVDIKVGVAEFVSMASTGQLGWFSHTITSAEAGRLYVFQVIAFDHKGLDSGGFEFVVTTS